jgi:hypothetical protein
LNKKETAIWVTFRRKGLHRYPDAGMLPELADVKYLGNEHRHLFWFKVGIQVFHDNRDIEFHQFLNWLESLYDQEILNLDYKSCEMISDDLARKICEKYPGRNITIDISEDGEVGAETKYYA